jgi:hypothetical protein
MFNKKKVVDVFSDEYFFNWLDDLFNRKAKWSEFTSRQGLEYVSLEDLQSESIVKAALVRLLFQHSWYKFRDYIWEIHPSYGLVRRGPKVKAPEKKLPFSFRKISKVI